MKVRFLISISTITTSYAAGEVRDLPPELAQPWVNQKACELLPDDAPVTVEAKPVPVPAPVTVEPAPPPAKPKKPKFEAKQRPEVTK